MLRAFLLSVLLTGSAAADAQISGQATVIDGDTIEIHGQRIRLHGIDAPESNQSCRKEGGSYRCGRQAAWALDQLIGRQPVHCIEKDQDRYGRMVGECFAGEQNLNAAMVRSGQAMAYRKYSRDYVRQETLAREEGAGIWAGSFTPPWEYRRGGKPQAANDNCPIKGNISRKGKRIFHLPGSRWYDRTRIDPSQGERWFCSEAEARKAGWRKAR